MSTSDPHAVRVVFFGTADFAVPSLQALVNHNGTDVVLVVTQPDRPSGRGRQLSESPVKSTATAAGLPVLQPMRLRSRALLHDLAALKAHFFIVAAYGRILPEALLAVPSAGCINVHGSLLPAYRGAAPIQRALMDGCEVTGVTTIAMSPELDAGDILMAAPVRVGPDDNAATLGHRLADTGARLLLATIAGVLDGSVIGMPQDPTLATYAPPITPEDTYMDWSAPSERLRNLIRAMAPRPGAVTWHRGKRLKVLRAATADLSKAGTPGTVVEVGTAHVVVAAGKGALALQEVQPEGRRAMSAGDWARGVRLSLGEAFDSPPFSS
jgi:methionyl-tRNA formyltransferase